MICPKCGKEHATAPRLHWSQAVREYDWRADFPLDQDKLPEFKPEFRTKGGLYLPTEKEVIAYGSH